jgi:hypothetical protein
VKAPHPVKWPGERKEAEKCGKVRKKIKNQSALAKAPNKKHPKANATSFNQF